MGRRSRLVLTISEFSKTELVKYSVAPESKIKVVYSGVSWPDTEKNETVPFVDSPFVMTVGSMDPRKNLIRLLNAWKNIPQQHKRDRKLVVASRESCLARGFLELDGATARVPLCREYEPISKTTLFGPIRPMPLGTRDWGSYPVSELYRNERRP